MKKIKFIILGLLISLTATGCEPIIKQLTFIEEIVMEDELVAAESILNIGFNEGNVTEFSENIVMIATDFTDYKSEYNVYSSSLHYDCLSENEKVLSYLFKMF